MNYIKSKSRLCHLLSLCIALTLFQACDVDDLVGLNYEEVKHLGSFFGDANHGTVIIHTQGGPTTELEDQELIDLIKPVNTNRIIVANIHQFQIMERRPFNTTEITVNEAARFTLNSVDSLTKVIRHFKSQDKEVFVIGSGYGGYIAQEVMARYGADIADKFLIMGSRLDIEESFVESWTAGKDSRYDFDSTPAGLISTAQNDLQTRNMNRLFGSIATNTFSIRLMNESLSNATYVFFEEDEEVGAVTASELQFLESKNATVITNSGNHINGLKTNIAPSIRTAFGIE